MLYTLWSGLAQCPSENFPVEDFAVESPAGLSGHINQLDGNFSDLFLVDLLTRGQRALVGSSIKVSQDGVVYSTLEVRFLCKRFMTIVKHCLCGSHSHRRIVMPRHIRARSHSSSEGKLILPHTKTHTLCQQFGEDPHIAVRVS